MLPQALLLQAVSSDSFCVAAEQPAAFRNLKCHRALVVGSES
jgi:hypothetical protein